MSQISNKPFTTAEDQVKILERRGVICDERTQATLLREGYYAIINGYKAPFLDPEASRIAREEFRANDVQVDAVRRHMWPIGLTPPRNMEGWVVVAADKCCSVREAQRYARDAAGQLADTLLG